MKLSELISELQKVYDQHGDIEVRVWDEVEDKPIGRVKVREVKQAKNPPPPHVVVE